MGARRHRRQPGARLRLGLQLADLRGVRQRPRPLRAGRLVALRRPPNGWSALCDGWTPSDATVCAVDKSAEVVAAAYVGIAAVAVAFVAGVVRALIARSREAAEAAKQAALAPLAAE